MGRDNNQISKKIKRRNPEMFRRIFPVLILAIGVILYGCSLKGAVFQNAENAFVRGDYAEAKRLYNEIIQKYQGSELATKAKFRLAQICEKEYDWDNALKYYKQVTKEVKGGYLDAQSRSRIALIRKARQDIARAKYIYDNNPGTEKGNRAAAKALYDMAQAYERLGQYEKAIETYEKLLKEFPKYKNAVQVQYQIGMIYFYKLYDYDKGWKAFLKVIKNYPDSDLAKASDRLLKQTEKTLNEIAALIEDVKKIRNEVAMKFERMGRHVSQADKYSIHADKAAQNYIGIAQGWKKLKNYPNAIRPLRNWPTRYRSDSGLQTLCLTPPSSIRRWAITRWRSKHMRSSSRDTRIPSEGTTPYITRRYVTRRCESSQKPMTSIKPTSPSPRQMRTSEEEPRRRWPSGVMTRTETASPSTWRRSTEPPIKTRPLIRRSSGAVTDFGESNC
ncbi:TPA: tetratricopeptide repeat protein [Candidatus Poribacteria bacterium]|nr:tetratricopeptide repeat protein [Candidatus Poribacteria bacterium]